MRGAGGLTFISGGLLVLVAWIAGRSGLPEAYRPVANVLAELLALLLLILAWRFRRSRLAAATIIVALANFLIRGPLADQLAGGGAAALLALLLPVNLGLVVLLRDQPLPRRGPLILFGLVLIQPWLAAVLLNLRGEPAAGHPALYGWLRLLQAPQSALLAFLIAGIFVALAFAARRGTFEIAMLWVLAAAAVALLGASDAHGAALLLAAGQLALLFALIEDSYRLAYHDELTGLPGRRALEEALRSLEGEFTLAMVDIDHFKRFNDRYGHEVGDQALRMVADELTKVGGGGRSYRYGGEEFAVVFGERPPTQARDHLEELRRAVASRSFAIRSPGRPRKKPAKPVKSKQAPEQIALTVSIGAAGSRPDRALAEEVLRAADAALYRAKGKGRNRVVVEGLRARKTKP